MMISDGEDDRFTDDEDEDEDTHPGSTDAVTGSPPPSLGSSEASQDLNDTDNSINALNAKKMPNKSGIKWRNPFFQGKPRCQLLLILQIPKT